MILSLIVFANHVLHTQVSTVFVNHVVPLQHTDTGKKTDFRRKVTIGVTTQNSGYFGTKFKHKVLNWLLVKLRDK